MVQEDARALLQQHLCVLATAPNNHTGDLCVLDKGRAVNSGHFHSKQAWINAKVTTANVKRLRALIEVVGQLSKSPGFQWRECYHSFWKSALITPLACSSCRLSVGSNPETTEFDDLEQLMRSDGPRFLLDFSKAKQEDKQIDLLYDVLLNDPLMVRNTNLMAKLTSRGSSASEAQGDRDVSRGVQSHVPRRIELGIVLSRQTASSDFRALATLLDEYAERNKQSRGDPNQNAIQFQITTLWIPSDKLLVPIEIDLVTDIIAAETATIQHLHFENAFMMLSVAKRLEVFQQLLRTTVCALPDANQPTLRTLHLRTIPLDLSPVASICSALWCSNSLRDLHLEWTNANATGANKNTQLVWAWIAFGIFHSDSEAKLDRLNLSGLSLTKEDLAIFALIIRSPHPARELWILEHERLPQGDGCEEILLSEGQRLLVQLKADTKMRVGPQARAKAYDHDLMESEEFEVAITLANWVCVVVFGCGLYWVTSTSIKSRREVPSKCRSLPQAPNTISFGSQDWPLAGANVKTFDRHLVDEADQFEDIKLLLRMIGHCLDGFNFPNHKVHITNSDLAEILSSCPKLTHLNLKGNALTEIGALVDKFENQQCRIAFLNVHSTWRHHKLLSQLSDLLARPCSKPLKYAGVNGLVDSDHHWAKLERALKVNKSLQVLFLYSPNGKHSPLLRRMQTKFEQETTTSSLPIDAKIAFLSVIKLSSKKALVSTSLGKLDSRIASQVFAFAGVRTPRILFW